MISQRNRDRRCWGLTRNLWFCGRRGDWILFCPEHRRQPFAWIAFLVFTVLGGAASILSLVQQGAVEARNVPRLEVRLRHVYDGFEVTTRNIGNGVAEDAFLQIVSWANGAPKADIRETIKLPPMVPGHEYSSILDLTNHPGKEWVGNEWVTASSSGYIVASCKNCRSTRAWAFYLPNAAKWTDFRKYFDKGGFWPLAEFRFPDEKPGVGTYVRYPEFGQPGGWRPPAKVGSRKTAHNE